MLKYEQDGIGCHKVNGKSSGNAGVQRCQSRRGVNVSIFVKVRLN